MRHPLLVPLVLATCLAPTTAQSDCPRTKAVEIPPASQMGPARDCSAGIDIEIGGVKITDRPRNCPFWLVFTPTHHESVPTTDRTYAHQYATASEVLVTLACVAHRFLFFKIDTSCDITDTRNAAPLPLMYTRGCVDIDIAN